MDRIFETNASTRQFLAHHLAGRVRLNNEDDFFTMADGLLPTYEAREDVVRTPGTSGLQIAGWQWVIRDDDLRLLDNVLDGLKASAGVGFFVPALAPASPTPIIAAIIGIVVALVKLGQQIRHKGIFLQSSEYAVLAVLHEVAPLGLREADILAALQRHDPNVTVQEVGQRLENLKEVPAPDGTKVVLVQRFPDGLWRTSGI